MNEPLFRVGATCGQRYEMKRLLGISPVYLQAFRTTPATHVVNRLVASRAALLSALPITRDRSEFCVRERTARSVRAEQRSAHRFSRALLDGLRAGIVVEVRLGEPRGDSFNLDSFRLQLDRRGFLRVSRPRQQTKTRGRAAISK